MNDNYWNRACKTKDCNVLASPQSDYCKPCKDKEVYSNQDAGFYAVTKEIQNAGIEILNSKELNQDRYRMSYTKDKIYMIMYKKDFFNSFGKIFESKGESGVGETINVEDLQLVVNIATDLVFVYKSGKIYTISMVDFMEHSHRRVTDAENKAVRSVSIRHFKDFKDTLNVNNLEVKNEIINR